MIPQEIDNYILGQTDESFTCIGEEDGQQVVVAMVQQVHRHIDILSRYFDPEVYDNTACYEAFAQFILQNRYARIRVLLHEPRVVAHRGHRILELGQRLTSFFYFRRPAQRHRSLPETFMIADHIGTIHRPYPDSLKMQVNFKDTTHTKKFSALFTEIWEEAEPDPNMCHLVL